MFLILGNIVIYGQQTICHKTIKNYSVDDFENNGNGSIGSTYRWQIIENNFNQYIHYITPSGNKISIDWRLIPSGIYTLEVLENGICNQDQKNIEINVLDDITINLESKYYICPTTDTIHISVNSGYDSYQWFNENHQLINMGPHIEINTPGNYQLIVSNGSCTQIFNTTIETIEFPTFVINSNLQNTITITLNGENTPLLFQLEDLNGNVIQPWQSSNQFIQLPKGNYLIKIKTLNGNCITTLNTEIFNLPTFFSPNGDGINDYWNLSTYLNSYPDSIITIFDRYGKVITKLTKKEHFTWDGYKDGKVLRSDSYWYSIDLKNGQRIEGFLLLKNKTY